MTWNGMAEGPSEYGGKIFDYNEMRERILRSIEEDMARPHHGGGFVPNEAIRRDFGRLPDSSRRTVGMGERAAALVSVTLAAAAIAFAFRFVRRFR